MWLSAKSTMKFFKIAVLCMLAFLVLAPRMVMSEQCIVNEVMESRFMFDEPWKMEVSTGGSYLLVLDKDGMSINVVDTLSNIVTTRISLGFEPCGILIPLNDRVAYISACYENQIAVLDISDSSPDNWVFTDTLFHGFGPMAMDDEEKYLYAADFVSHRIFIFDTKNLHAEPGMLDEPPDGSLSIISDIILAGGKVFVSCEGSDSVAVFNAGDKSHLKTIAVGDSPVDLESSPDGSTVYVANEYDASISIISTDTLEVVKTAEKENLISAPVALEYAYETLYIADKTEDYIVIFNTKINDFDLDKCTVGSRPADLIYVPARSLFYVSHQDGVDYVETISGLSAVPETITIPRGGTATISVSGGSGIYIVVADDPATASAAINGSIVTVTGNQSGETDILIQDTSFNRISVPLIVEDSADFISTSSTLTVYAGNTGMFTVSGGLEPYSAASSDSSIADIQVTGNTVLVKGLTGGNALITVNDTSGNSLDVEISVKGMKKALIVAGGGPFPGNTLWDATSFLANFAYNALISQGYTKDTIYFLSHDMELDVDANGEFDDIDDTPSCINIQNAVTTWAQDAEDLLIYIVDHGGDGVFRVSESEYLQGTDLNSWLDDAQSQIPGRVVFIYDACLSGSFIPLLASHDRERILIASAAEDQYAYFTSMGLISFSYFFWGQVMNGAGVYNAFCLSKNAVEYTYNDKQQPLLDDNNNGVGNDYGDGYLSGTITIGNGVQTGGALPVIGSISPAKTLNGETSAVIYVDKVTDSEGIQRVWAVITPPGYDPGNPETPVVTLPELEMSPTGEDGRYEGTYNDFTLNGHYSVTVYAKNDSGSISVPLKTAVEQKDGRNHAVFYSSTARIFIPCLSCMESCFSLNLDYHPIPSDPDGIYFCLDMDSLNTGIICKDDCSVLDAALNIIIPEIAVMDAHYMAELNYSQILSNGERLVWELNMLSFNPL